MIDFLLLMIVPVLLSLGWLIWEHNEGYEFTDLLRDGGLQIGAAAIAVAIGLGAAYWSNTTDTELWNGQVTGKASVRVSCSHSYPCHCHESCSGSGKNESCTTVCDTCYEHAYDIDWDIYSSTEETVSIDRVDSQGLQMPERWSIAYVGEPFSSQHRFTNYILANPSSVLLGTKGDLKTFGTLIPKYPKVEDYYHAQHFFNMGVPNVSSYTWNYLVSMANRTLGPSKQVNLIVITVPVADPNYMYALRDAWVGGKKNDAIIIIGSVNGHDIDWASVVSWTPNKEYNVYLRDRILDVKYLDHRDEIVDVITQETTNRFQRMHMKDYKWLTYSFHPSIIAMIWTLIFGLLACAGATYVSHQLHEDNWA